MRVRAWAVAGVVAMASLALAGCGKTTGTGTGAGATAGGGVQALGSSAPTAGPAPTSAAPGAPTKAAVPALTCDKIKSAQLGSPTVKYNGYPDSIPLSGGTWSGEDGNTVKVTACAVGDLTGDGAVDAMASVMLNGGGTGQFYALAVWRNLDGAPVFTAVKDLGDRNPVKTITISGNKATVVYFTRHDDEPMAILSITRTAVYKLVGVTLTEVSHSDGPYTP